MLLWSLSQIVNTMPEEFFNPKPGSGSALVYWVKKSAMTTATRKIIFSPRPLPLVVPLTLVRHYVNKYARLTSSGLRRWSCRSQVRFAWIEEQPLDSANEYWRGSLLEDFVSRQLLVSYMEQRVAELSGLSAGGQSWTVDRTIGRGA
jgi:hypothetical protein